METGAANTDLQTLRRWNQFLLLIVILAMIGLGGGYIFRAMDTQAGRLNAAWRGDTLHLYSGRDGPFVVTHLFKPWNDGIESSVAELPDPITIIDSRGERISADEIGALTWIGASGKTNTPPPAGTPRWRIRTASPRRSSWRMPGRGCRAREGDGR